MRIQTTVVTLITHPAATAITDHTPMGQHMVHMCRQHTEQITGQLCRDPEDMQMDHLHPLEFPRIGPHMR
jgi:5-methylcytosine-specific restriction endonuclease McrA